MMSKYFGFVTSVAIDGNGNLTGDAIKSLRCLELESLAPQVTPDCEYRI